MYKGFAKKGHRLEGKFSLNLALFNQSPRSDGFSPSEMVLSRWVRSLLPEIFRQPDMVAASQDRYDALLKVYHRSQTHKPLNVH